MRRKKKKVTLPPHVPSTNDMVFDIVQMPSRARKLLGRNARYELLLRYLIDLNYPEIENCHVPSLKEIATDLDIKYDHVRKGVAMIYHDLNFDFDQFAVLDAKGELLYLSTDRLGEGRHDFGRLPDTSEFARLLSSILVSDHPRRQAKSPPPPAPRTNVTRAS